MNYTSGDELRRENDRLSEAIAEIENKPKNMLAKALDDARINADSLANSLNRVLAHLQSW